MQAKEVLEGTGTKMCSYLMAEFKIGTTSCCNNTNDVSSLMCLLPRGLLISLYYNLVHLLTSLLQHVNITSNIIACIAGCHWYPIIQLSLYPLFIPHVSNATR